MIGLLPDRPQRGKSGLKDLARVAANFETLFAEHCRDIDHGRPTPEKRLQSWLIRDAYTHDRKLNAINAASALTDGPVELLFITDEISLPTEEGKIVCDLLALRVDGDRSTPVVIEVKTERALKRLVEQVEAYARIVDEHSDLFGELYGALLGRAVRFDGPCEKWIVWPAEGELADRRGHELRARGIRVVGYADSYRFSVGLS